MRAIAIVLGLLLPGCLLVVPKDRRTEIGRSEHWLAPEPLGQPTAAIIAHPRSGGVDVTVTWKQLCQFHGELVIQHKHSRGATVKVYDWCRDSSDGCALATVVSLFYSPVTLLVSGLITAGTIAGDDDRLETTRQPIGRRGSCETPGANLTLVVAAPHRDPITVTTDATGRARAEFGDDAV